jgi:HAD superfamily hydrolase (TIGR01509 family)
LFDAVIFDWDGTLADTRNVIIKSFQHTLKEVKCEVSDEFIEKRIGIGPINIFKDALKSSNITFEKKIINKLVEKKINFHIELTKKIKLFEGATELLGALRKKVKLALATMSNRRIIDTLLKEKKVKKYFNIVISFNDVQKPKPDPEIFLKSAAKLNCQPKNCLVIEDSKFGVIAAKKANMKCIAITSGAYSKMELEKERADLIVNSLKEKQKILSFILN